MLPKKCQKTLSGLGPEDLVILSLHVTIQIDLKKSDVLDTMKDDGKLVNHLTIYRPRKKHLIFEDLWNLRAILKTVKAKFFILDNYYKYPYCCSNPLHNHKNLVGHQLYFNRVSREILGGTSQKGPHVLDHRLFLKGLMSKKSLKNSKKYANILLENQNLRPTTRKQVGERVATSQTDKGEMHTAFA